MNIDKSTMRDDRGRPKTQSLFLEATYERDAIYTFKDEDYTFEGKLYISIKKLYLEFEDITEYEFANKYFLGWKHWQRICDNQVLARWIVPWREELELKIRSQAIRDIVCMSAEEGSFQASKWLSDRGWDKKAVGRPSKAEQERESNMKSRLDEEFNADVSRMENYRN